MLATVPFQMGTSITSSSPFSPDIVTFTKIAYKHHNRVWDHHESQPHLAGSGGDGVDGAHEDVRHDEDGHEAVEEAGQVEGDPEPERPGDLIWDMGVVHSHWSRSNEARLSLVESFRVLLRQCLLCHKEPARRIQSPLLGALERKKPPTRGFLLAPRWFFMA